MSASCSPGASSENIQRTIAILQKILDNHARLATKKNGNSALDPDTERNLHQIQTMMDKLQSPLFSSLVEIQSKYKQVLNNPQRRIERPCSTALEFSAQPDAFPQFCQRYGISDIAAAGDKSFDDKQTPESDLHVSKKKKLAVIKSSGGLTSGFISGSGRLVPVLGKESPKTVALADLAKQPVHTDEKEMRELDGRVGTSLVPSSTESSLSSISVEVTSQNKSVLPEGETEPGANKSKPRERSAASPSDLVIVNQQAGKENPQMSSMVIAGNPPGNVETLQMMVLANASAIEDDEQRDSGHASSDVSPITDDVVEDEEVRKFEEEHFSTMELGHDDDLLETSDNDLLETRNKADSLRSKEHDMPETKNEEDSLLVTSNEDDQLEATVSDRTPAIQDESQMSYLSVSKNQEDFGEVLSSISEEVDDDNISVNGHEVKGDKEDEPKQTTVEEQTLKQDTVENNEPCDTADACDNAGGDSTEGGVDAIDGAQGNSTEGGSITTYGAGGDLGEEDTDTTDGRAGHHSGGGGTNSSASAAANNPKDVLFFMRDKKSLTELTEAIKRTDKGPRSVTISLGGPTVGGAKRAGMEIIGLSSTGVFIDALTPGSAAHHSSELRTGDQILKINDEIIEGKASFEVDLMMREAPSGQDITFEVLYNPIGYSECQRTM